MDERLLSHHTYDYSYEEPLAEISCKCSRCGWDIFKGDSYYEINNESICDECIRDFLKIAD